MSASGFVRQINNQLDAHYDEMVKLRRHFHQHPELSFQEKKTAAFIVSPLTMKRSVFLSAPT
ncbi:hypothetical protein EMIT013CA1_40032 [Bacillus sp. IT-13CA1]